MERKIVNPASLHPTAGYSHAAVLGNLVFVSGQVSKSPDDATVGVGDAKKQTEMVYENLKAVLEECGSGMDLIGKLTVFTTDIKHRSAINTVREKVFGALEHYPASTFVVVSSLAVPEWIVEIEAVAVKRG